MKVQLNLLQLELRRTHFQLKDKRLNFYSCFCIYMCVCVCVCVCACVCQMSNTSLICMLVFKVQTVCYTLDGEAYEDK